MARRRRSLRANENALATPLWILRLGMAGTGTGVSSIAVRFNGLSSNAIPASAIRT
jgi:hypothetical protein